ncbi:hypothetical protein F5Y10DRAFT_277404 [Nemania abortiva]|nr:hypothetical protein F5Y10DRAFT_277404 [Nemania abortiva]
MDKKSTIKTPSQPFSSVLDSLEPQIASGEGAGLRALKMTRLHLQHLLIQNTLVYLLEPSIEKSIANSQPVPLKLTELHSYLAKNNISAQLDGFDVKPINVSHAAYLPSSVFFKQLDILAKPLPVELVSTYHVVHIRAFSSAITDADLTPMLSALSGLLKPGDRFIVESPSPQISKVACGTIVHTLKASLQAKSIVNKFGFQDVQQHTEDYLMVWEELAVPFPQKSKVLNAPMSREAWDDLFANAVKVTEEGVVVHQGTVVTVIGKKTYIT